MTSLLLSFSTLVLALLSSWHTGPFPWEGTLLVAAVAAIDRGTAAFRYFFSDDRDPERRVAPGYALILGISLFAFAAVLIVFLSLRDGWPLLVMGGAALAAALLYASRVTVPSAPWGELLAGLVPGVLLWMSTAFILEPDTRWSLEFWWRTAALSVPSALFVASLATTRRSCEDGRSEHGVLLLPLAAYVAEGVLAAVGLVPWTFFLVAFVGPAFSAPLWRSVIRRGFSPDSGAVTAACSALMVYTLVSAGAWVTGNVLP